MPQRGRTKLNLHCQVNEQSLPTRFLETLLLLASTLFPPHRIMLGTSDGAATINRLAPTGMHNILTSNHACSRCPMGGYRSGYPAPMPFVPALYPPPYNRPISKILKTYPNKLIGIANLPLRESPSHCRRRIRRKRMEPAFDHCYQNINRRDLDSEFLWPSHAAVEKLGVPLLVRTSTASPVTISTSVASFPRRRFSGVLERLPKLKFGLFEVGAGWIPWLLDRLEMAYDACPKAREGPSRRGARQNS